MSAFPAAAQPLVEWEPRFEFFVGIDSDGCAFDSMEIKQKECFCPNTIKYWDLQPVARFARQAAEFVNLYSKWRGANRWPALLKVFDLLQERPEVIQRGAAIPAAGKLRAFVASGAPLSNDGLRAYMAEHPDPELERALAWSNAVNASIAELVHGVPPFPFVRASLQKLQSLADVLVVSATPGEALVREWQEHDIARYARLIAGQEMGTKVQQLSWTVKGRYAPGHALMIGDALGDLEAARSAGALFFPINPGSEDESWRRFYAEGLGKFMDGAFAGAYEASLLADFEKLLPATPSWQK